MKVFVRSHPYRQVVLITGDTALILQTASDAVLTARLCSARDISLDPREYDPASDAFACLGLVRLEGSTFVVLVHGAERIRKSKELTGIGTTGDVYRILKVGFIGLEHGKRAWHKHHQHPCRNVRAVLQNGHFYCSLESDLTSTLALQVKSASDKQRRYWQLSPVPKYNRSVSDKDDSDLVCNPVFTFNEFMLDSLLHFRNTLDDQAKSLFDGCGFCVPLIQGFFGWRQVTIEGQPAILSVISRLCPRRSGTRFNVRGIDHDGDVANHAETETILRTATIYISFVQVRGSVPLLWTEQPSTSDVVLQIAQPILEKSLEPFRRHMYNLFDAYGQVHCLSLMRDHQEHTAFKLGKEVPLNDAFADLCHAASKEEDEFLSKLSFEFFDLIEVVTHQGWDKLAPTLTQALAPFVDRFGATVCHVKQSGDIDKVVHKQTGTFRVNCRDCLDRTNLGEHMVSLVTLQKTLGKRIVSEGSELVKAHRELFFESGNALSLVYAGSPSMWCQFTKTGEWHKSDEMQNAEANLSRMRAYRYLDRAKEAGIDELTGHSDKTVQVAVLAFDK